ncbi:MAG: P-loop NTPase fold protein [Bacteroidota bacterium]
MAKILIISAQKDEIFIEPYLRVLGDKFAHQIIHWTPANAYMRNLFEEVDGILLFWTGDDSGEAYRKMQTWLFTGLTPNNLPGFFIVVTDYTAPLPDHLKGSPQVQFGQNGSVIGKIVEEINQKIQNSSRPKVTPGRKYYALSSYEDDTLLTDLGLSNLGLLGFVNDTRQNGTVPLRQFLLTFPRGASYFYTAEVAKEKFQDRNAISQGTLGFVRTRPDQHSHQLYRYFNHREQAHLYVINPNVQWLEDNGFKSESPDNQIFLKRNDFGGGKPLYLYSNDRRPYFTPILEEDNSDNSFPDEYKQELIDLLRENGFDQDGFSFTNDGPSVIQITVKETNWHFYINAQENREYFTVTRQPIPDSEESLFNELKWIDVLTLFKAWIMTILSRVNDFRSLDDVTESVQISDSFSVHIRRTIYSNNAITIQDSHEIEAAFGIENLTKQVSQIIKDLKVDSGNMTGVFGQWGRGKSRFMKEIWKNFEQKKTESSDKEKGGKKDEVKKANPDYVKVEFQAWRYQNTPASWAYLYEQFADGFLGEKKTLGGKVRYQWRLLTLNVEREGIWKLLLSVVLFVVPVLIALIKLVPTLFVWQSVVISLLSGAFAAIAIIQSKSNFLTKAITLVKKYTVRTSFKESLGIQAEIQKELVHLINTWVEDGKHKKIMLFVDDLDRCDEHKTMEIIDALRIILDDESIKGKLLVVTAIDERILRRAVMSKYSNVNEGYEEMAREYIDKLFIFSIKLASLTPDESREFLDKLIKDDRDVDEQESKTSRSSSNEKSNEPVSKVVGTEAIPVTEPQKRSQDSVKVETREVNKLTPAEVKILRDGLSIYQTLLRERLEFSITGIFLSRTYLFNSALI